MLKTIQIDGKDVEMLANAASPYIFQNLFHEDFIRETQKAEPDFHIMEKMGFVMAMQACKPTDQLLRLKMEDYLEWLAGFGPMSVLQAAAEIGSLYAAQEVGHSEPKKEDAGRSAS